MDLFINKGALISACDQYRYSLHRTWTDRMPYVNFIGLNPSTADAFADDPTIRRCISFACSWNYGGIRVTNLFAMRSTDPKVMMSSASPGINDSNDSSIRVAAIDAGIVIAAWGAHGGHLNRDIKIMNMLIELGVKVHCLDITKEGYPKHPLYIKSDTKPILYPGRP